MQETQETRVQFLGWEDPLEEGMATPVSILAWKIPWTEEPGGLQFTGLQRVKRGRATGHAHTASIPVLRPADPGFPACKRRLCVY